MAETDGMCPRCSSENVRLYAQQPDPMIWDYTPYSREVLQCRECGFKWNAE